MNEKELTILIPALNEEKTIQIVIEKAKRFIDNNNINGEVLVADNQSSDRTEELALLAGARVITVEKRGYGEALIKGINAAKGKYVIIGDADDSYNFLEIDGFMQKLREGYDIVIGNRFGGKMEKNSMKFLHKYIGTPLITHIIKKKYKVNINDINCGLRGIKKEAFEKLECNSNGMEFASEMILKASLTKMKITEIPINFYRDKREGKSHLRTIRDGIRHFKIILKYHVY